MRPRTNDAMRLGVARALVDGVLVPGDVDVRDGRVAAVGLDGRGTGIAAAGFVDVQVNGFAGQDFLTTDAVGHERAATALAETGVTGYCPTLITSAAADRVRALRLLAELDRAPTTGARRLGAHLEGPFLAPSRAGAHPPDHLCAPDVGPMGDACAAGRVRMVTLAPELPAALDVVRWCVQRGIVVSLGHTEATADQARRAFVAGAVAVTHVFNAMRTFHPRDPGIAVAALADDAALVGIVVDGVHLAPETVLVAWRAARERLVLVTDATAAAGMPAGTYDLGGTRVVAADGRVRRDGGGLAGSVLTMDRAVRNLVDLGVPVAAALGAATDAPRRLLGEATGGLRPGAVADVVVLDDDLEVVDVLVEGRPVLA